MKLKDFKVTDADKFFRDIAGALGKSSLERSRARCAGRFAERRTRSHQPERRRACRPAAGQTRSPVTGHDRDSRRAKCSGPRAGQVTVYVKVVNASRGRYGATHAATETGELNCGTKPPKDAPVTETSIVLQETTCRSCGRNSGSTAKRTRAAGSKRSSCSRFMLGLRPGKLRKLTWDHVDLDKGSRPRVALGEQDRRRQDAAVEAIARTPQARSRGAQAAQEAPGRRAAQGRRLVPRHRAGVLLRGRAHVQPLGAELAVQQR